MKWATLVMAALELAVLPLATPAVAARKKPAPAVVAPPAPPPPSVRQGVELWRAGDWAGAVAMWQPFADAGDPDAMFNVGQAHKLGRSVPRDVLVARDWYRKAALKNHLPAQANLGILLFQAGEKAEAVRWLKSAADRNEMRAQYVLGVAHWNGDGVPRSLVLAYAYLARASAQGLAEATNALNNLTATIPPQDRANGWAVALSLAAGTGIPPAYANPGASSGTTAVARAEAPSADAVLKPLPKPVPPPVVAVAPVVPPAVTPAPRPAPVTTAAVTPPPVAVAPPPKPLPAVIAPPRPVPPPPLPAATAAIIPTPPAPAAKPPVQIAAVTPATPPPLAAAPTNTPEKPVAAAPKPAPKPPEKPPEKPVTKPAKPGWRVQLGAFSRKSQAEAAWKEVAAKQKAVVAKQTPIYAADGNVIKLQMGPYKDKAAARDACAKIAFSGRACFVTEG